MRRGSRGASGSARYPLPRYPLPGSRFWSARYRVTRRRWSDPFIAHAPMQRSRRLRVQCGCAFVAEVDIVRSAHFGALVLPLCAVLLCCCGLVRCCYGATVHDADVRYSALGRRRRVSGSLQDYAHPRDSFASLAFVCQILCGCEDSKLRDRRRDAGVRAAFVDRAGSVLQSTESLSLSLRTLILPRGCHIPQGSDTCVLDSHV